MYMVHELLISANYITPRTASYL